MTPSSSEHTTAERAKTIDASSGTFARTRPYVWLLAWTSFSLACSRAEPDSSPNPAAPQSLPSSAAPAAVSDTQTGSRSPGAGPLAFEWGPLDALQSDYALVPSKNSIDLAFEYGHDKQTFVYLGATVEKPGEPASEVRWLTQQRATVPNALILPIRRGESVNPGDVLLTSWASGSGLQRAIVVPGGRPESPKVRYLDLSLDNPAARAEEDDLLPPNTFHRIRQPGEVGSSMACRDSEGVARVIVLKRRADKLLGLGFAGRLGAFDVRRCVPMPLIPDVQPGDRIYVAMLGGFSEGEVERVDGAIGRVVVRLPFSGEEKRTSAGFTNVALSLPSE